MNFKRFALYYTGGRYYGKQRRRNSLKRAIKYKFKIVVYTFTLGEWSRSSHLVRIGHRKSWTSVKKFCFKNIYTNSCH